MLIKQKLKIYKGTLKKLPKYSVLLFLNKY